MGNKFALLIAEDEPEIREQLVQILAGPDLEIISAANGQELLAAVAQHSHIVAVLSDIMMQPMSGMEALHELRQKGNHLPFVFLTGYGNKELVVEALRSGAMDFLEKPYRIEHLRKVIARAIELGKLLQGVEAELQQLANKFQIPANELERFRAVQKPVLLMKLKNKVFFPKKSA